MTARLSGATTLFLDDLGQPSAGAASVIILRSMRHSGCAKGAASRTLVAPAMASPVCSSLFFSSSAKPLENSEKDSRPLRLRSKRWNASRELPVT